MQLHGADSGGKINTAYIERLNITIRNSLARFVRKSMNCSKILGRHTHAMDFFQAWYNFVKSHKSLRLRIDQGRKKWMKRTPDMAEGLNDNIWTIKKLISIICVHDPRLWLLLAALPLPRPLICVAHASLSLKFALWARSRLERAELSPQ